MFLVIFGPLYADDLHPDRSIDSILDFQCGSKTYDGHNGTDFVLKNFKQMDAGVSVLAAADGLVTAIKDGFFDRNKTAVSGNLGNFIAIKHTNNYYSYYGHLKKNSILVKAGEQVLAGQAIAEVGSSGYSSDPHLHFELWFDSLYVVDPFTGNCSVKDSSLWLNEFPYIDRFGIIDSGICNFHTTLDTLKERIPTQLEFSETDDTTNFWMQGYGIRKGDISKVNWYSPQNLLWFSFSHTHPTDLWYYYFSTYILRPPINRSGKWKVEYLVNDKLKFSEYFDVNAFSKTAESKSKIQIHLHKNGEVLFSQALQKNSSLRICNYLGQDSYSTSIHAGTQNAKIPIHELKPGNYYIILSNSGSIFTKSFVKM